MRPFNRVVILLTIIIFLFSSTSNAIPTAPSPSTPLLSRNESPNPNNAAITTSLIPRDLSTPSILLTNTLKILYNNFTISLAAPAASSALNTAAQNLPEILPFYTKVASTIVANIAKDPAKAFVFTVGAYQMVVRCASEAIPWTLLGDVVETVKRWTGERWGLVKATFSFEGASPYLGGGGAVVIWVVIQVLGLEHYA